MQRAIERSSLISQPVDIMNPTCLFVFVIAVAVAAATEVHQCPGFKSVDALDSKVQLTPCKKIPCRLKKGTNQNISITFTPDTDLPEIKNHVTGEVFGLPVPFIGVDGNSICDKVFTENGEKAQCPLKAGTKYVYNDSFPILSLYPSVNVKVHWALRAADKNVICFEVPARIA